MSMASRITKQLKDGGYITQRDALGRDELVAPMARTKETSATKIWEGSCDKKPWDYKATAVIPHLDSPDLLRLCVTFLRRQTVRPFIVVVDTGSRESVLPVVNSMRAQDLEVQSIACNGVTHPSELVSYAMDVGQAVCRTEWLWSVHSDCFVHSPTALEELLALGDSGRTPILGYQSVPRPGSDWWRGYVSHTCSLFHLPTVDSLGGTWSMRRLRTLAGSFWPAQDLAERLDTEVLINETFRRAGVAPLILGEETADGVERDERRVHLRAATALALARKAPGGIPNDVGSAIAELCAIAAEGQPGFDAACRDRLMTIVTGGSSIRRGGAAQFRPKAEPTPPTSDLRESKPAVVSGDLPVVVPGDDGLDSVESSTRPPASPAPVSPVSGMGGLVMRPPSPDPTVVFIAPFFRYSPVLLSALENQTYPRWRLLLVHDGPCPFDLRARIMQSSDARVHLLETAVRYDDWGHSLRALAINRLAKGNVGSDWVVHTNGDNYYVPGFCERMLEAVGGKSSPRPIAAYCDMIHNYWRWTLVRSSLAHGEIDCGALMVDANVSIEVGWPGRQQDADWTYVAGVMARYGDRRFRKVDKPLFIHN